MGYQGCIALNPGDSNLIRNVRVDDVRVEDFRWGQLIHMRVMYNPKYNTSVGRGIEDVYVKDLTYTGTHADPSLLLGYDADHAIKDVTFENLVVNGTVIARQRCGSRAGTWPRTACRCSSTSTSTNLRFLTTAEAEAAPRHDHPRSQPPGLPRRRRGPAAGGRARAACSRPAPPGPPGSAPAPRLHPPRTAAQRRRPGPDEGRGRRQGNPRSTTATWRSPPTPAPSPTYAVAEHRPDHLLGPRPQQLP